MLPLNFDHKQANKLRKTNKNISQLLSKLTSRPNKQVDKLGDRTNKKKETAV